MHLPALKVFDGEVIGPGATIDVLVQKHPVINTPLRYRVGVGQSLEEILQEVFPNRNGQPMSCYLLYPEGEDVIPPAMWRHVRPKSGTSLIFRATVEGKFAKSLAMIGVAILAITAAFFLGPILAGFLPAVLAPFAGSIIAGAITIAGSLAVQALFPTKAKKNSDTVTESAQNVFSISGAQNQARPFQAVPVVLGTHKISPPYAGQPYTEYLGNDQYLTVLFCPGYGPLSHFEQKIGETPFTNYNLYQYEAYAGLPGDPGVSFYPYDVHQEDLSIRLLNGVQNIRATADNIDQISIDFQAPEGLQEFFPDTGIRGGVPVNFSVYYRLLPGGGWQLFNQTLYPFTYGLNALRQGYTWQVARGQYEVMITRNYSDSTDTTNVKDQVFWTALRSTRYEAPVHFDAPVSLIGMKLKATDQLSGVIDTFNLIVRHAGFAFTGGAWNTSDYTSNPADIFRTVLQGAPNKMPVPDAQIDFPKLEDWWRFCNTEGFTYNAVIEDTRSVYAVISEVCAAGRAVPTWRDGKWSVIWDNWDDPIVQHFTPRNSNDFKGERVYRKLPHGLRVRFINAVNGYTDDEMIVYDDGYTVANATLFEQVEFPGVTDPNLIWRHGRYHIAQARLRPEFYTLSVDMEHLRCTRGDRVRVQHDVALIGQVSGRVTEVDGQTVTLDEVVVMEPGKAYGCRFRLSSGDTLIRDVAADEAETDTFTLTGAGAVPAVGDLAMFGEREYETGIFRVFSVQNQDNLSATLTLVDDAPDIIFADQGTIPPFDTNISDPVNRFSMPPRNLTANEVVSGGFSDVSVAVVHFSWVPAHGANVRGFEAQVRDESHQNDAAGGWYDRKLVTYPQTSVDFGGILLGTYSFRVRTIFEDGSVSSWAELNASEITGSHITSPLPDIQNVRTAYVDGVIAIRWDDVVDFRPIQYEIRRGDTWATALLIATVAQPPFAAHGLGKYWIAAVSRPVMGVVLYSPHPVLVSVLGSRLVDNVLAIWDEKATGWSGVFTGSVAVSGDVIRTGGGTPFLTLPDFLGTPSLFDAGGTADGSYYMPAGHVVDAGSTVRAAVTIDYDGTGSSLADSFLDVGDFLATPDFLGSASARFVEVYPIIGTKNNLADPWFWQRWQPGVYSARYFTAAMILNVLQNDVAAYCLSFTLTVDVPDRVERYTNLAIASTGTAITFRPEGAAAAAPFHGGPNGSTLPNVSVTILNASAGDDILITARTLSGCTVRIVNAGAGVARNCDIIVQGY